MSSSGRYSILSVQNFKILNDNLSGLTWHDDIFNITSFSCFQWVGESMLVICDFLLCILASEDNFDCSLGSHDGNLSAGPTVIVITM